MYNITSFCYRKEIIKKVSKNCNYGLFDCLFKNHALEKHNYNCNSGIVKNEFLFIGDSRIAGGDWNRLEIAKKIKIDKQAIGGTRASEWSKRVCIQHIIDINPKLLFIGVGGNDIGSGQSYQSIIGDLQKIIFAVKRYCPQTEIFFHCCLPVLVHGKAKNEEIRKFNEQLYFLCEHNNCGYIGIFEVFNCTQSQIIKIKNGSVILNDSISVRYLNMDELPWYTRSYDRLPVHLNSAGYELWYKELDIYFKNNLVWY